MADMAAERIPSIIKFGYHDFGESQKIVKNEVKYRTHAKCNVCELTITETRGTTSSYTRCVSFTVSCNCKM